MVHGHVRARALVVLVELDRDKLPPAPVERHALARRDRLPVVARAVVGILRDEYGDRLRVLVHDDDTARWRRHRFAQ